MRTSSPTVSLVSSLVAVAMVLAPMQGALAAPSDDEAKASANEEAAEEPAEGEEGEETAAEGEEPAEGEEATAEGEEPAEGEEGEETTAEGEEATAEGEEATAEGEEGEEAAAEGEEGEGEGEEAAEGEGEGAEGEGEPPPTPSFMPEEDDRPPEPRIANKPATGKGLMIAGGVVGGVGLGLTIAFSLMTRRCSFDGPLQCGLQNQDNFLIPLGAATLLTGTMLLGVGVGYSIRYKRWQKWTPEDGDKAASIVVPTATRGGAGLAWTGRF